MMRTMTMAVGLVWAVASLGYADVVTVHLTGYVTLRDGPDAFPTIVDGAAVTGSYTYNDAAPSPSLPPYFYGPPGSTSAEYPMTDFTLTFADTAFAAGSTLAASSGAVTLMNAPVYNMYLYGVNAFCGYDSATLTGSFAGSTLGWEAAVVGFHDGLWADFPALPDPSLALSPSGFNECYVYVLTGFTAQGLYFAITSVSVESTPETLEATIALDPGTLNLGSNGRWITGYVELPAGYQAADIDVSTVKLNDTVAAATEPTGLADYNGDGVVELMVKFDRADVAALVQPGQATLTVSGTLTDGTPFEGAGTIQVIAKGKKK